MREKYDVGIIGAGVLGVTAALWLSSLTCCSIALIDKEMKVAAHTTSRNTGVVHRPFYLNPEKKRVFARAAQKSYFLWSSLAKRFHLAWSEVGTLEVAIEDPQLKTLNQYLDWAMKNGMEENEVELLNASEVQDLEPPVKCVGAIHSKRDTGVDYGELTGCVSDLAMKHGVEFLGGQEVKGIEEYSGGVTLDIRTPSNKSAKISCEFLLNLAGGNSMDLAHQLGLAKEYTDLHFRGEYWIVEPGFGKRLTKNIYSVARHTEFPFLDPHFIVRTNGRREVGPNAVLVSGPNAYKGLPSGPMEFLEKIFERPNSPKLKLFTNPQFLSLVWQEWRSSSSKKQMCNRVKQFIPSLEVNYLCERGLSGVRSSVIDGNGFVPEAIILEGRKSLHVLNYNSPGATGAPAFSAYIVRKLLDEGHIQNTAAERMDLAQEIGWDFETAADL